MSRGGEWVVGPVAGKAEAVEGRSRGWTGLARRVLAAAVCWSLVLPAGGAAQDLGDVDTAKKLAVASLVVDCVVQDRGLRSVQDFRAMTAGELADSFAKCVLEWKEELDDAGLTTEKALDVMGRAATVALYLSAAKQKGGGRQ